MNSSDEKPCIQKCMHTFLSVLLAYWIYKDGKAIESLKDKISSLERKRND